MNLRKLDRFALPLANPPPLPQTTFARGSKNYSPRLADRSEPQHVSLDEALAVPSERGPDLVSLDEALSALAEIDPRQSRIVELRFFGGLSVEETTEALRISSRTVVREWNSAKAWLYRELGGGCKDESSRDKPRQDES